MFETLIGVGGVVVDAVGPYRFARAADAGVAQRLQVAEVVQHEVRRWDLGRWLCTLGQHCRQRHAIKAGNEERQVEFVAQRLDVEVGELAVGGRIGGPEAEQPGSTLWIFCEFLPQPDQAAEVRDVQEGGCCQHEDVPNVPGQVLPPRVRGQPVRRRICVNFFTGQ